MQANAPTRHWPLWLYQVVLRSTDLRDSLDEQCIADIVASIVGGQLIERSKDALDDIYIKGSAESERVLNALEVYGPNKIADEFKYCIDELFKICNTNQFIKLRDFIFENKANSAYAFPSVFAVVLIALHELIVEEKKKIADYQGMKNALNNLSARIDTSRKATAVGERRKNINTVKGLIRAYFVQEKNLDQDIYGNHTTVDIEAVIRRSEIELANYELKQEILKLSDHGDEDPNIIEKVVRTACAIANIGTRLIIQ